MSIEQKPIYKITVDGQNITTAIQGRLINLGLSDNRGFEADQLDLSLDDSDGLLDLPSRGAVLNIAFGWESTGLVDKGSFTVDEISHSGSPDTMTIRARSADLRAGLTTQRERSWHQVSVDTIIRTIAAENDLTPTISPKLASQVIAHMDQTNESSANFLTRLAGQFDAIATVKAGRLLFIHAGAAESASGKPMPAITITRQTGDNHNFSIADRGNYTHVKATYNDTNAAVKGEIIWGAAEDAAENKHQVTATATPSGKYRDINHVSKNRATALRLARKEWRRIAKDKNLRAGYIGVKAPYNDKNMGVSGEVAYGIEDEQKSRQSAKRLAERDAARTGKPQVAIDHSADNIKTLRHVYASKESAKRAARTEWRKIQRGMAEFSITLAHGNPELVPETPVTVQGFKQAIDGTGWIITKLKHDLSDNGLTTAITLEIRATEIPG